MTNNDKVVACSVVTILNTEEIEIIDKSLLILFPMSIPVLLLTTIGEPQQLLCYGVWYHVMWVATNQLKYVRDLKGTQPWSEKN